MASIGLNKVLVQICGRVNARMATCTAPPRLLLHFVNQPVSLGLWSDLPMAHKRFFQFSSLPLRVIFWATLIGFKLHIYMSLVVFHTLTQFLHILKIGLAGKVALDTMLVIKSGLGRNLVRVHLLLVNFVILVAGFDLI